MEYSRVIQREAEKAIQLNPKNDLAYLVLAKWNFEMSDLNPILRGIAQMLYGQVPDSSQEKAIEYFKKAISITPPGFFPTFVFPQVYFARGKRKNALRTFIKPFPLSQPTQHFRLTQLY